MFGMTKQTVSSWEVGRNMPSAEQLARLAEEYEVGAEVLLLGRSDFALEIAAIFDGLDDHGRRVLRATAHSLILPEAPPPRCEPVPPPLPTVRPASVTKKPAA